MTAEEKEAAKQIYFERCAGCHGVLRKGATGKNLEPHWTKTDADGKKTEGGTSIWAPSAWRTSLPMAPRGGMVNYDDILTKEEINMMARYIQNTPPEFSCRT